MEFTSKYKGYHAFFTLPNPGLSRLLLMLFLIGAATLSTAAQSQEKRDTTIILLADKQIQLECTQGLNDLYNFKFDRAEAEFQDLKVRYGWHPLPYFFDGLERLVEDHAQHEEYRL